MTSRFCGAASSVMSLMVATTPVSWPPPSNIWVVRITTSRSMPLPVCSRTVQLGAEGVWFRPTRTPHPGSHKEHLEDVLAVFPEHLLGGHAEEFLRGPVDSCYAELRVVQNQSIGKLVEHRF